MKMPCSIIQTVQYGLSEIEALTLEGKDHEADQLIEELFEMLSVLDNRLKKIGGKAIEADWVYKEM